MDRRRGRRAVAGAERRPTGDLRAPPRRAARRPRDVRVGRRARRRSRSGPDPAWHTVPCAGDPFDVVNNVGTHLVGDGYAADRGWLERDNGQYERTEDVFAWCGAAVLLRADYLRDVGTFDERLFLYSEDLELSWRGLRRGWRHRYVPASVVRHVHSATSARAAWAGYAQGAQPAARAPAPRLARAHRACVAPLRPRHALVHAARRRRPAAGGQPSPAGRGARRGSGHSSGSCAWRPAWWPPGGRIRSPGPAEATPRVLQPHGNCADRSTEARAAPAARLPPAPRMVDHG